MRDDFDEILVRTENAGGRTPGPAQMAAFSSALVDGALSDLGFEGCPFKLSNNRVFLLTVRCRLYMACATVASTELLIPRSRLISNKLG